MLGRYISASGGFSLSTVLRVLHDEFDAMDLNRRGFAGGSMNKRKGCVIPLIRWFDDKTVYSNFHLYPLRYSKGAAYITCQTYNRYLSYVTFNKK